jgi:hypothetical protein
VLSRVCFMILALEGAPKLNKKKKKKAKAKEGEREEQEVSTKVVSGMHVHLRPCYLSQPCLSVGLELVFLLSLMAMGS